MKRSVTTKDAAVITTYNGGKNGNGTYQQIINLIPPHKIYIEPFVGSGAVFRYKLPAVLTILNDKDPRIFKYWTNQVKTLEHSVSVYNMDALDILTLNDTGSDVFIYLDAPYLFSTRKSQRKLYTHDSGDYAFHVDMLYIAAASRNKVMISGYDSELYQEKLKGWHVHTFQAQTRQGMRTECLWMNYPAPVILHDDRYLGNNFRQREKIKMKRDRWLNRFRNLSPSVRMSILNQLNKEFIK